MNFYRVIIFMFISSFAYADDGYRCVVKDAKSASISGQLITDSLYKGFINREFFVDRKTGRMLGSLKNYESYGFPKVLNGGTKEKAFRVITVYKPSVGFDYLTIESYDEKQNSPFIFVSSSTVLSGICSYSKKGDT